MIKRKIIKRSKRIIPEKVWESLEDLKLKRKIQMTRVIRSNKFTEEEIGIISERNRVKNYREWLAKHIKYELPISGYGKRPRLFIEDDQEYVRSVNMYGDIFYSLVDDDGIIPHRQSGPAIAWNDGVYWWLYFGKKHRIDGPAEEWLHYPHLNKYFLEGKELSYHDWLLALSPEQRQNYLFNMDRQI